MTPACGAQPKQRAATRNAAAQERSAVRSLPYPLLCTALGLVLGWLPLLLHGPIADKFNVLYIRGSIAVWGFYTARVAIGLLVGISTWPTQWFLRGPLLGALTMLPVGLIALATPGCGST